MPETIEVQSQQRGDEIVVIRLSEVDRGGSKLPEDYKAELSHGGAAFTLRPGTIAKVSRKSAEFFRAKFNHLDNTNILKSDGAFNGLEILELEEASEKGLLKSRKDWSKMSHDDLAKEAVKRGLAKDPAEAKKMEKKDLMELLSEK